MVFVSRVEIAEVGEGRSAGLKGRYSALPEKRTPDCGGPLCSTGREDDETINAELTHPYRKDTFIRGLI